MQATVHTFDPATRSGAVVTDDGELLPFGGPTLDESPLRGLRVGQRLMIEVTGSGAQARVTRIGITSVGILPAKPSRP
jgi:2-phospho-L-lactate guanylyltransferase